MHILPLPVMDKKLTIYYQNCRGIRTKLQTLYMNILTRTYDIIILTETWLVPEIGNNEFIDQRYVVYRCDRDRASTSKRDGGGVLVAILKNLQPIEIDLNTFANANPLHTYIEQVAVEIPSGQKFKYHVVAAAYIPPKTPPFVYEKHFETLYEALCKPNVDLFYVAGDYNLPEATWHIPPTLNTPITSCLCVGSTASCDHLNNFMSLLSASQYNYTLNCKGKILDLLISNASCSVQPESPPLLPADIYHPPFVCNINITIKDPPLDRQPLKKYNFYKANYENINDLIQKTDWHELLTHEKSEEALSLFYNKLDEIIRSHTPLACPKSSNYPVWFSRPLINIFKKKQKAWIKWKKYGNISDYEAFTTHRASFKDMCGKCFSKYISSVEDSLHTNIKHFWTYVSNKKDKPYIPAKVYYKDTKATEPEVICDVFSNFFHSVYEPASPLLSHWQPPAEISPACDIISSLHFNEQKIRRELRSLDPAKGPGPDGIPAYFLRRTAAEICKPLTIIYNKCITEGVFPKEWKRANITPVHKGGSKGNVENYRPISLLSTLSKVFEKLVHNELYPVLHNIIIPQQHGFVKLRSTTTNLLSFSSFLFDSFDNGLQVDAVYTDFCKAFDKVDHELLLNKIAFNGIRGNLLRWFASYILNRCQRVVINGYSSRVIEVTSGVPQGSILGPLLFNIFVNDIGYCFHHTQFLMYADDLKVYKSIKTVDDSILFQQDLDRLTDYCHRNKLKLSIPKCNFLTFTKNKHIIKYTYILSHKSLSQLKSVRDLGVIFDTKLCLDLHINKIVSKAFQLFGFVMRSTLDFKKTTSYLCLYKALVRSQLEYAVSVWIPFYKKYAEMVENVQYKFLRAMHYRCHKAYLPYPNLLSKYKLLSLSSRRKYLEATVLYNIVRNRFNCTNLTNMICYAVPRTIHRRQVRAGTLFALNTCRTNSGLRSPVRRMVDTYNVTFVDIDIFNCSINKFKSLLHSSLLNTQTTL